MTLKFLLRRKQPLKKKKKKKMATLSQNYFNLGNTKAMKKLPLPSLELTILQITVFLSTKLKNVYKKKQIENKKYL